MDLQVIATGSTGNCYVLHAESKMLLLDAGIPAAKIMKAIEHRSQDVEGCLITHEHKDHCAGGRQLWERGIWCAGSPGTKKALDYLIPLEKGKVGGFWVKRIPVLHDAEDPCGWLICNLKTGEKMIYATDTYWLPNTYPGLHYWLIECNYCDELVAEDDQVRKRLQTSHMSLDWLCKLLKQNDLSQCKKIVLCHISQTRGDYQRMIEAVKKATGKPVEVAIANTKIELELEPF